MKFFLAWIFTSFALTASAEVYGTYNITSDNCFDRQSNAETCSPIDHIAPKVLRVAVDHESVHIRFLSVEKNPAFVLKSDPTAPEGLFAQYGTFSCSAYANHNCQYWVKTTANSAEIEGPHNDYRHNHRKYILLFQGNQLTIKSHEVASTHTVPLTYRLIREMVLVRQ